MNNYEKAIKILEKYNNITTIKELLEKYKNEELINQILFIDFEQIALINNNIKKEKTFSNDKIENIPYTNPCSVSFRELQHYTQIGEDIIKNGHYAVVTMAGGMRNKAWL